MFSRFQDDVGERQKRRRINQAVRLSEISDGEEEFEYATNHVSSHEPLHKPETERLFTSVEPIV